MGYVKYMSGKNQNYFEIEMTLLFETLFIIFYN